MIAASRKLPVAVVGCGAFGRHHARVISQLPGVELTGVFDTDAGRAAALAQQFQTRALNSLEEVCNVAKAVTVAAPTQAHSQVTVPLFEAGLDVMLEKPIANTLDEADQIIRAAAHSGRILQVGHLERFNPAVRLLRPRISEPLFFEVHRLSVFTARSLDVDVLLDLMIHDLDIVLSFVKSPLEDLQAVGLAVLTPFVDIANVRLTFANGCVANLTASRVSTEKVRKLRFFQPGEYISLDYTRRDARIFTVNRTASTPPGISHQHLEGGDAEPLVTELSSFVECVRTRQAPEAGAKEARAALAAALRATDEIRRHHQKLKGKVEAGLLS